MITIYKTNLGTQTVSELCNKLNGKKFNGVWLTAKPSKYANAELFISYFYYETIENELKSLEPDIRDEIIDYLKQNGKNKVLKRIYAFINTLTNTLEIYSKRKSEEVKNSLEKLLDTKFEELTLTPEDLKKMEEFSLKTKLITDKKIVFKPKIKFLNPNTKYYVTLTNNELRVSPTRPRFEIRQLIFQISMIKGLLKA
jgi:hypothetical protein